MGLGTNWGITVAIDVKAMSSFTKSAKALEAGANKIESVGQKANSMIDTLGKTLTGRVNDLNAAINTLKSTVNDPKLKGVFGGSVGVGGGSSGAGSGFELPKFKNPTGKKTPKDVDSFLAEHLGFPTGAYKKYSGKRAVGDFESLVGRMPRPSRETKDRGRQYDSVQVLATQLKGNVTIPIVESIALLSKQITAAIAKLNLPPQPPTDTTGSDVPRGPRPSRGGSSSTPTEQAVRESASTRGPPKETSAAHEKRQADIAAARERDAAAAAARERREASRAAAQEKREKAAAEARERIANRSMDFKPAPAVATPAENPIPTRTMSAREQHEAKIRELKEKYANANVFPPSRKAKAATSTSTSSNKTTKDILTEVTKEVNLNERENGPSGTTGRKAMQNLANLGKKSGKRRNDDILDARVREFSGGDEDAEPAEKKPQPRRPIGHFRTDMQTADKFRGAFDRVLNWGSAAVVVYGGAQKIQEAIKQMADFDEEMTKVRRSMIPFGTDFTEMGQAISKIGSDFGVDINELARAAQTFAKQGEDVNSVLRDTAVAAMATNTTELSLTEATEGLIAAQREFLMGAGSSLRVLDSWTQIERTTAVGANVLAEATRRAGTASRTAGVDFDTFNGIVGAVGEQTRKSGDTIGTAMKFIFQHIRDVKAVESLQQVGVFSEDTAGNFKSARQTLGELASKWGKLTDAERTNVALSVAGTEHLNDFNTMMETWARGIDLSVVSMTSQGAAMRANQITMESLNKHVASLKQSFAGLFAELGNTGMIQTMKTMVDLAKSALQMFSGANKFTGGMLGSLVGNGALVGGGLATASFFGANTLMPALFQHGTVPVDKSGSPVARRLKRSFNPDDISSAGGALPSEQVALAQGAGQGAPFWTGGRKASAVTWLGAGALQYSYNRWGRQSSGAEAPSGRDTAVNMGVSALSTIGMAGMFRPAGGFMKGGMGGKAMLATMLLAGGSNIWGQYQDYKKAHTANTPENAEDRLTQLQAFQEKISTTKGDIRTVLRQTSGGSHADVDVDKIQEIKDAMQAINPAFRSVAVSTEDFLKELQTYPDALDAINKDVEGKKAAIIDAMLRTRIDSPDVQKASKRLSELEGDQQTKGPTEDLKTRIAREAEMSSIRQDLNQKIIQPFRGDMVNAGSAGSGTGNLDYNNLGSISHRNPDDLARIALQEYMRGVKGFGVNVDEQLKKSGLRAQDVQYYQDDENKVRDLHTGKEVTDKKTIQSNFVLKASDSDMTMEAAMVQAKNINQLVNQYEKAIDKLSSKSEDLIRSVAIINQNLIGMAMSAPGAVVGGKEDLASSHRTLSTFNDIAKYGVSSFKLPDMSGSRAIQSALVMMAGDANQKQKNPYGIAPAGRLDEIHKLEAVSGKFMDSLQHSMQQIFDTRGQVMDLKTLNGDGGDPGEKAGWKNFRDTIGEDAANQVIRYAQMAGAAQDKGDTKTAEDLRSKAQATTEGAYKGNVAAQIQKQSDALRDYMQQVIPAAQGALTSGGVGYSRAIATGQVSNAAQYAATPEGKQISDDINSAMAVAKDLAEKQQSYLNELASKPGGKDSEDYKNGTLLLKTFNSQLQALTSASENFTTRIENVVVGMDKLNAAISRMKNASGFGGAFGQTGLNADTYAISYLGKELARLGEAQKGAKDPQEAARIAQQIDELRSEQVRRQTNVDATKDYRSTLGEGLLTTVVASRLQSAVGLTPQNTAEEYRTQVAAQQSEFLQKMAAELAPALQGKSSTQVMQITEQMKPMLNLMGAKVHDMMLDSNVEFRKQYLLASPSQRLVADSMRQQIRQGATAEEIFSDPYTRGAAKDNPLFGELMQQALESEAQTKALDFQQQIADYNKQSVDIEKQILDAIINPARASAGLAPIAPSGKGPFVVPGEQTPGRLEVGSIAKAGSSNIDPQGRIKRDWTPAYLDKGEVVLDAGQSSEYLRRRNRFAGGTIPDTSHIGITDTHGVRDAGRQYLIQEQEAKAAGKLAELLAKGTRKATGWLSEKMVGKSTTSTEGELSSVAPKGWGSIENGPAYEMPSEPIKRASVNKIHESLPAVSDGMTRLWRGNRPGEVGTATTFTNSLEGIAQPFAKFYNGPLSYIDVASAELGKYEQKVGVAVGAEFNLPAHIANNAKAIEESEILSSRVKPALGRRNIIATESAKLWGRAARNPALDGPALRMNFTQEDAPWQQAILLDHEDPNAGSRIGARPFDQTASGGFNWDEAILMDEPLSSISRPNRDARRRSLLIPGTEEYEAREAAEQAYRRQEHALRQAEIGNRASRRDSVLPPGDYVNERDVAPTVYEERIAATMAEMQSKGQAMSQQASAVERTMSMDPSVSDMPAKYIFGKGGRVTMPRSVLAEMVRVKEAGGTFETWSSQRRNVIKRYGAETVQRAWEAYAKVGSQVGDIRMIQPAYGGLASYYDSEGQALEDAAHKSKYEKLNEAARTYSEEIANRSTGQTFGKGDHVQFIDSKGKPGFGVVRSMDANNKVRIDITGMGLKGDGNELRVVDRDLVEARSFDHVKVGAKIQMPQYPSETSFEVTKWDPATGTGDVLTSGARTMTLRASAIAPPEGWEKEMAVVRPPKGAGTAAHTKLPDKIPITKAPPEVAPPPPVAPASAPPQPAVNVAAPAAEQKAATSGAPREKWFTRDLLREAAGQQRSLVHGDGPYVDLVNPNGKATTQGRAAFKRVMTSLSKDHAASMGLTPENYTEILTTASPELGIFPKHLMGNTDRLAIFKNANVKMRSDGTLGARPSSSIVVRRAIGNADGSISDRSLTGILKHESMHAIDSVWQSGSLYDNAPGDVKALRDQVVQMMLNDVMNDESEGALRSKRTVFDGYRAKVSGENLRSTPKNARRVFLSEVRAAMAESDSLNPLHKSLTEVFAKGSLDYNNALANGGEPGEVYGALKRSLSKAKGLMESAGVPADGSFDMLTALHGPSARDGLLGERGYEVKPEVPTSRLPSMFETYGSGKSGSPGRGPGRPGRGPGGGNFPTFSKIARGARYGFDKAGEGIGATFRGIRGGFGMLKSGYKGLRAGIPKMATEFGWGFREGNGFGLAGRAGNAIGMMNEQWLKRPFQGEPGFQDWQTRWDGRIANNRSVFGESVGSKMKGGLSSAWDRISEGPKGLFSNTMQGLSSFRNEFSLANANGSGYGLGGYLGNKVGAFREWTQRPFADEDPNGFADWVSRRENRTANRAMSRSLETANRPVSEPGNGFFSRDLFKGAPVEGGFNLKGGLTGIAMMWAMSKLHSEGAKDFANQHGFGTAYEHYALPVVDSGFEAMMARSLIRGESLTGFNFAGSMASRGGLLGEVGGLARTAKMGLGRVLLPFEIANQELNIAQGINRIRYDMGSIDKRQYMEGNFGVKNTELAKENLWTPFSVTGRNAFRVGANSINWLQGKGYNSDAQAEQDHLDKGKEYLRSIGLTWAERNIGTSREDIHKAADMETSLKVSAFDNQFKESLLTPLAVMSGSEFAEALKTAQSHAATPAAPSDENFGDMPPEYTAILQRLKKEGPKYAPEAEYEMTMLSADRMKKANDAYRAMNKGMGDGAFQGSDAQADDVDKRVAALRDKAAYLKEMVSGYRTLGNVTGTGATGAERMDWGTFHSLIESLPPEVREKLAGDGAMVALTNMQHQFGTDQAVNPKWQEAAQALAKTNPEATVLDLVNAVTGRKEQDPHRALEYFMSLNQQLGVMAPDARKMQSVLTDSGGQLDTSIARFKLNADLQDPTKLNKAMAGEQGNVAMMSSYQEAKKALAATDLTDYDNAAKAAQDAIASLKGDLAYTYGPTSKPSDIDDKLKIYKERFGGVQSMGSDLQMRWTQIQSLADPVMDAYSKLPDNIKMFEAQTHSAMPDNITPWQLIGRDAPTSVDVIQNAINELANYGVTAEADRSRWATTQSSQQDAQTAAAALRHLAKPVLERKMVPAFDHQTGQLIPGGGKELMTRMQGDTQWRFSDVDDSGRAYNDTSSEAQVAAMPSLMAAYRERQNRSAMPSAIIDSYMKHLSKDKNASGQEFFERLNNGGKNADLVQSVQRYQYLQQQIADMKVDTSNPDSVAQMTDLQAQRDNAITDSGYSPEVFQKAQQAYQASTAAADARDAVEQAKKAKEDAEAAARAKMYADRDMEPVWSAKRHTGGQTVSSNEYVLQNTEGLVLTGSRMEDAVGMLGQISKQGLNKGTDDMGDLARQFMGRTPEDRTLFHEHSGSVDVNMKGHADFVQQIAEAVAGHLGSTSSVPMNGQRIKRSYEA